MRNPFEQNIKSYNEIAKDVLSEKLSPEEEGLIKGELESSVRRASLRRSSDTETQKAIYSLQVEKQKIMEELKESIALLDTQQELPERSKGEWLVTKVGDKFVVTGDHQYQNGQITKSELLTDIDWGINYVLDPESVDRLTRKNALVESAKRKLMDKLNEQIVHDELSSNTTTEPLKGAYRKKLEGSTEQIGGLAEKMVKNFLKKISIDHDVDFEVSEADVYEDVHKKIDFIVRCRKHRRGVGVEEISGESIGVQFTVNTNPHVLEKKVRQVAMAKKRLKPHDHIDDIVLVSLPSSVVSGTYNSWRHRKKSGGPDKLWSESTKKAIFYGVMKGIYSPEEIDEQWQRIDKK